MNIFYHVVLKWLLFNKYKVSDPAVKVQMWSEVLTRDNYIKGKERRYGTGNICLLVTMFT